MCRSRARPPPAGGAWGCACSVPRTLLLLLVYLAYLALGTGVFWTLEGSLAWDSRRSFQSDKWALLRNFTCLDGPALDSMIRGIVQAYKSGSLVIGNTTSMERWELVGSFFFSVSTITTIGYGNLSPHTLAARLFCIFFALVGIPLNLVVLNRLGHLMLRGMHRFAHKLGSTLRDPGQARWLAGCGALLAGLLLFLLLPPLLFSSMEGWNYMEGFYFAFITLSTVGFGDYMIGMDPSRKYPVWYKNMVSLWILFGMAWLALIIQVIFSFMETSREVCSCYRRSAEEEDLKPPSWESEPHPPLPACREEEPMGVSPHLEPSTQAMHCDKDS
ncbi:potassium channel subfamily K member 17 [Tenrec ecaudatus]|uniref:potassium channel subfamily K member 17 n=1 Tax=Tenrec ecaudatus TaxID=94439 RepID=UPI003F5AB63A